MKYVAISLIIFGLMNCNGPSPEPVLPTGDGPTQSSTTAFSLDEVQRRTFNYFWETALPGNYQIPDRWPTERFSSIAATGFGLTSYLVGIERGFVSRAEAAERTRLTLEKLWSLPQGTAESGVAGYRGFFYHFLTNDAALRYKNVELSTIDSGLLLAGVLSSQSYFDGDSQDEQFIRSLADSLYLRTEWDWIVNDQGRISMGWRPEKGFISSDWNGYNEAMILLVLALGSPTHPVPDNAWEKWTENYFWAEFQGQKHLDFGPLFGHQYSQMYIDFRGIQDDFMRLQSSNSEERSDDQRRQSQVNYFENSRVATLTNRAYCIENPSGFKGYGENNWGLSACDGPGRLDTLINGKERSFFDYRARGASARHIVDDGTITPTAAGGSVPFAPDECIATLKFLWTTYQDSLIGQYGYKDAFNLSYPDPERPNGWFDVDYLGIDQGPILIQIENHRSGLVWELMKKNKYIRLGLEKAGFTGGWLTE